MLARRTLQQEIGRVDHEPGQQIVACRYTLRRRRSLAPATAAPRCTATCGHACHRATYNTNATSATAATDAAAATSASTTASAAAAATASAPGDLHAATDVFLVEEMEGGEADVGNFFVTKRDHLARRKVRPLLNIARWYDRSRCASRQRKSQSGSSQRRYGGFDYSLLFRGLLHPLHGRILQRCKKDLRQINPTPSK
jgi:hypothetical protein